MLVTPLAVEVREDAASGRVRTTVKDTTADRYVSDVHVKVIGTGNAEFVSGSTDLRGVFVADGIQGTSTVIAQAPPQEALDDDRLRAVFGVRASRLQAPTGPPHLACYLEPEDQASGA